MTILLAATVAVLFGTSIYMLMGRELKGLAMGMFLLGHAANLAIIAVSGSPLGRSAPVLGDKGALSGLEVDPLPQALILTAIVIGFAVQAFLLTLLVLTWRRNQTVNVEQLDGNPVPAEMAGDSAARV